MGVSLCDFSNPRSLCGLALGKCLAYAPPSELLPAGIVTLGARASVRGSACMDKKRHNLDRLLQSASNFQHRQQMLSIQRDKALPKSGIIARDVLLALIF